MEFRILGPLEAIADGTPVDLRGVEARLLAALLLDADRAVSLTRLVEAVWDGEPPATATRQVGNTVSILRRKLGARLFHRVADGYRLDAGGSTVDVREFDALTRRARATAGLDLGAALKLYREALGLWRGEALSGLPGRFFESAALRLSDARLSVLADKVDLELELGDDRTVIAELRQVLTEHPYRQRAAGQLMLALHRHERTHEALDVYDRIRTRLSQDLGLDPGEQLRERHTAILRGDPSLDAPAATTSPPKGFAPAQLPAPTAGFTGRVTHLACLDDALNGASRSSVVTGAAGTGKTALAVHWSHRVREEFPDGQLFIDLRGFDHGDPVPVTEVLGRFIRALNGPDARVPADVDEAVAEYRTATAGKRVLVVLDNAHGADQVRPLLPPGPDSFTVITSRNRLRGLTAIDHALPVDLAPLAGEESVDLLRSMLDPSRFDDPAAVTRLAELCGHLPLALRVAAAQLVSHPETSLGALADDLDGPRRLDALSLDGDAEATVATALDLSYNALDADAREVFLVLGVVPGDDYARELIPEVNRLDEHRTLTAVDRLETLHLLEQHHPGRYRFHDLTRLYASAAARRRLPDGRIESIHDKFIDWHQAVSADIDAGFGEDLNISRACRQLRTHPKLWQLIEGSVVRDANAGRRLEECRLLVEMALSNARRHHDVHGEIKMRIALAGNQWATGDFDTSVDTARDVAALAQEPASAPAIATDHGLLARILRNLAVFLRAAGKIDEAESTIREALAEMPEMANPAQNISPRLVLVRILRDLGKFAEARRILAVARTVTDDGSSPEMDIMVRSLDATIAMEQGRLSEARAQVAPMLAIAERTTFPRHSCEAHHVRAMLYLAEGRYEDAEQEYLPALQLAHRINRYTAQALMMGELAKLSARSGRVNEAYGFLASAAALNYPGRAAPEPSADLALATGIVHNIVGDHESALDQCRSAASLNARMPRPLHHARSLAALAGAHAGLGDHDTTHALREQALTIFTRLDLPIPEQLGRERT